MYTIDDIDVYVITHNRCEFLKQTLESLMNQSVPLNRITVLDNESVDDTEQVVAQYTKDNVLYYKTFSRHGNFLKAQELTAANNTKYVMTFHDDDLLHPEFFEKMLLILNSLDYAPSVLLSAFCWFPVSNCSANPPMESQKILPKEYLFPMPLRNDFIVIRNPREMVQLLLYVENPPCMRINPCICSALYRKDLFLKRAPQNDKYGKIDDIVTMIQLSGQGNVPILADKSAVFHRNHRKRDAVSKKTGNTLEQSLAWIEEFCLNIDRTDTDSYQKLIGMIQSVYPIISSAECFREYPAERFIKKLMELGLIPSDINVNFSKMKQAANIFSLNDYINKYEKNETKLSLLKWIFSIGNEWKKGKKRKVLRLFGIRICLGVKKRKS
ncbi:MAG: glycosyltransferase family 2 protein [Alphaproteobacteria bacterium]|nr:glycosyltransferase family 2 protein [Alphaproteobacteria bacterium]